MKNYKVLTLFSLLLSFINISFTLDMITPSQPIRDGYNETLVSSGGIFEAGFFNLPVSNSRYVGIWYKEISPKTYVWVANKGKPLSDSSGVLKLDGSKGTLSILDSKGIAIWSSNATGTQNKPTGSTEKPIVKLLESGNLVVTYNNSFNSDYLWQSFDFPGDTLLPGMKLGWNLKTRHSLALTSWKSMEDPTPGEYSMGIDTDGYPQLVVKKAGNIEFRAGSWNGLDFTGLIVDPIVRYRLVQNKDELFYQNEYIKNSSVLTRCRLLPQGYPMRLVWSNSSKGWDTRPTSMMDGCEPYSYCGENTNCNVNGSKMCDCLIGFTPKSPNSSTMNGGCARATPLDCQKGDSFHRYEKMKLPDTSSSWYNKTIGLKECEKLCLSNCSCTAYSNLNISDGGSGCLHWFHNVVDMRSLAAGGQDFYIRVTAASQLDHTKSNSSSNWKQILGIVVSCIIFIVAATVLGLNICIKKKKFTPPGIIRILYCMDKSEEEDFDLPIFDFSTISKATNHFAQSNKLGQGGFGPVYKGVLPDKQEIAVKRLSKTSGQGTEEFKNEVMLIAKLQHRNLVKLLGCSIHQHEKLLIYEFMPNRSLDYFIFDSIRSKLLDWTKRIQIINGIARGLLYLHQDSRLRIIHRDLKTSNILLDNNMNPKISDFGLARIFGGDQAEANTNRVMGTYGYMPPEYAVHGSFSDKSDIFSFGVIVLEVISSRKNRGFSHPDHLNLLGHAWRLWKEERLIELMDDLVDNPARVMPSEILRCIHVGLLCVQERPEHRPNMPSVVLMLNGERLLPEPSQPGFYTGRDNQIHADSSPGTHEQYSINEASISTLEPR